MVNLSKRMHKLMPKLWNVKSGHGAAILPPKPPAPQLTSLVLRLPNPCSAYDEGARKIWKNYLPGLRYHNLTLPITVEQTLKAEASVLPTMTLQFQSQNREVLDNLEASPRVSDIEAIQEAKSRIEAYDREEKIAEVESSGPGFEKKSESAKKKDEKPSWIAVLRDAQEAAGVPAGKGTKLGQVQVQAQPAADPSTPSTTSPPATTYTRTITLGLRGRSAVHIWGWFEKVTQARHFARTGVERASVRRYDRFFQKAHVDRMRVKAGMDAMRKEKADLKQAREAAERLASEA